MNANPRSRRVRLIVNGKVASNEALRIAVVGQREVGHCIEVRVTWEKGDAQRFASEAGEVDLLIAAGGDGTLNEVVHGLMGLPRKARPVFGLVPLGTANDFATGCGIPRDPETALALCLQGKAVPIDVGKANEHWFLNVASAGFGAEVTATTSPELKRLLGPAAYTVMGIITERSYCRAGKSVAAAQSRSSAMGARQAAVFKSLPAHLLMTVCSTCWSCVISRQRRRSLRPESFNSFHPMASISPIGKPPGRKSIPKKQFPSIWMASRYGFRASGTKRYRRRFSWLFRRIVPCYRQPRNRDSSYLASLNARVASGGK